MKQFMQRFALACAIYAVCCSCGKNDTEPDPVSPYFISFKYNDTAYEIRDDETCIFTKHAEDYFVVEGSNAEKKQALGISIAKRIEKNGSYDIYAILFYIPPSISVMFSSGDEIAESGFATDDPDEWGKIGELTITELTDELLSGTFSCKMTNGEITEGQFSVKAREYD